MKNTNQGYVGIPRIVLQLPIWSDPHEQGLWFYCMLTASRKPFRGLKPGQFYTSKEKLAKALGWSKSTVYKSLAALQQKHLLQTISSKQGTIITVCYWAELTSCQTVPQSVLTELGATESNAPVDPILAILQQHGIDPATDEESDSTEQGAQMRSANAAAQRDGATRRRSHAEIADESKLLAGFNLFWEAYPKKANKKAAWEMYRTLDADPTQLMEALAVAKNSTERHEEGGRYIPAPANWLDGAWERYVPVRRG